MTRSRTRSSPGSLRSRLLLLWLVSALLLWASGPGFRSRAQFNEHYQNHGAEFGHISKAEYLRLAQELRYAPARGPILQAVQRTGVITKFDTVRGYFVAYNPDGTIRTFFIPVDGERYFRRQARR